MKILIVVDMQNDFINGCLGTPEAKKIVPAVVDKVKNWDGAVLFRIVFRALMAGILLMN